MRTILIIDDEPMVREPLAAVLRSAGYNTMVARNGLSARDIVANSKPDLIILDLAMPELDGLSFLKELRCDPEFAHLPVIILTASTSRLDVVDAARLGVKEFMSKSEFSLSNLMTRIATYVPLPKAAPVAPSPVRHAPIHHAQPHDPSKPQVFHTIKH